MTQSVQNMSFFSNKTVKKTLTSKTIIVGNKKKLRGGTCLGKLEHTFLYSNWYRLLHHIGYIT